MHFERTVVIPLLGNGVTATRIVQLHLRGTQVLKLERVAFGWNSFAFTNLFAGLATDADLLKNAPNDFAELYKNVGMVAYVLWEVVVGSAIGQQMLTLPAERTVNKMVATDLVAVAIAASGSAPDIRMDLQGEILTVSRAEKLAIAGQSARERRA